MSYLLRILKIRYLLKQLCTSWHIVKFGVLVLHLIKTIFSTIGDLKKLTTLEEWILHKSLLFVPILDLNS